jgi:hypothetical protein
MVNKELLHSQSLHHHLLPPPAGKLVVKRGHLEGSKEKKRMHCIPPAFSTFFFMCTCEAARAQPRAPPLLRGQ